MISFDSPYIVLILTAEPEQFSLIGHTVLLSGSDCADISLNRSEDAFLLVGIRLDNLHWSPSIDVSVAWLGSREVIFRSDRSGLVSVASDVSEDGLLGCRVSIPPGVSLTGLGSGLPIPPRARPGPVHVSLLRLEDRSDWASLSPLVTGLSVNMGNVNWSLYKNQPPTLSSER